MAGDPYLVLGVGRDATEAEIKAAYRRLAATYHPDRNPGFQDAATEKLKELNAAYDSIKSARSSSGTGPPRPTEDDGEEAEEQPEQRSAIAAEMSRIGLLEDEGQEDPTLDAFTSALAPNDAIALCLRFDSFAVSDEHGFREVHRSLTRIGHPTGASTIPPPFLPASRVERGEAVICTSESLIWATKLISPLEFPWEEVSVTAYSLALADILGAKIKSRRKGSVDIWIDDGPTLTFHTGRSDAERLCEWVDAVALSL
jgi:DnaJ domain